MRDSIFDLTGKVALVTGTSRGLGQHMARALARGLQRAQARGATGASSISAR
jgi:NAD(P)-dependent dehydrogenase (short-subunit alcohol dehydrogenase family)